MQGKNKWRLYMNCVKRAMCYIRRKVGKTVLLFFIFLVADCTILGTLSILDTSSLINDEIRRQTNSKVSIEGMEERLTEQEALKILEIDNVNSINRIVKSVVDVNGFAPVFGGEEDAVWQVNLCGFDDLEKDSPFTENVCRIVEGTYAKGNDEVVINQFLAEVNEIKIGDTISFISGDETVSATVIGFYLTGSERKQTDTVATINRMENQIYTNTALMKKLSIGSYEKIIAYVDNPELLPETADSISENLGDKVEVSTQDTMYQKMKFSIMQVERVTKLIFVLTVITSVFVVGMLLCMWMRNRKVEMAVFISLGISKAEVFLQMMIEIIFIYSVSCLVAAGAFYLLTPMLSESLGGLDGFSMGISFSLWNVWKVWFLGVAILMVTTLVAMFPCLTKKTKDTLSEMEG